MLTRLIQRGHRARRNRGIGRVLLCGLVLWAFVIPLAAEADESMDPRALKTLWQNRYRELLVRAGELRATIDRERELYADANRRNYRRGSKRKGHYEAVAEATAELKLVDAELATIEDDGRRAGVLPGWFYEVEGEFDGAELRPSITEGPGDEGRNPIYLDEDRSEN